MKGQLHHIEIYAKDLKTSKDFWGWLLQELGYSEYQSWKQGISYIFDKTYLVFVQVEQQFINIPYHRCGVGLNHLSFDGGSKKFVDEITIKLKAKGINILYENKHPYAGGEEYYALFFEDPDRIKVEIVA
jgi:catechol 2,3-dioxygenase-like lactoylglutathione lyase family enzyme